ncbi:FecR domain-containing protein [Limibaculum sp. M0105]|uniref:FecR domain-containing protein n=1 Tax=Thermohalobaculum xanthum TaxID=2753746 RepID=A0A8J7M6G9_9RHOB|nr:FecR domain-containing protein [Thermohalobaculum xanthum]MBK0399143.1 FecR domain-containing protein [Thermohalobaculum xanthum]
MEIVALDGTAILTTGNLPPRAALLGDRLCPGDSVRAGDDGRVELRFAADETTIGLARNTEVRIPLPGEREANVELRSGLMRFISSVRDFFSIDTRYANAGIDGTEAVVAVSPAGALVVVAEGDVTMRAPTGAPLSLPAGAAGFAAPGQAALPAEGQALPPEFRALVVRPEAASDWAIYYPPILLAAGGPPVVEQAARLLDAGEADAAEALLEGRTDAPALALGAVVAVFRNQTAEGAELALRAVETDPGLGAAHVAQSYAFQAQGHIDDALKAARRAVAVAPDDGFARARLAELQLIAGDAVRAGRTAAEAADLAPTSLAQAIIGFARLQANDYEGAAEAFAAGVALDSEDPMPRIGEGLLSIRRGDVVAGRRALELAASLDPRRGPTRDLLGRAYDQEGLFEKALSQYGLAIELDPNDPAPWLSRAEVLFAENRPVEALADLKAAEQRSGARSVLRSERGLAEDQAIRGAAVARVYDTLGFSEQAIREGAHGAEQDPANAAAHRVLADVLRSRANTDTARASSAFRAQVYEQPSKAPIQPSLSESDLALLNGPGATRPAFAELFPFFDTDGVRADVEGFGGTQSTFGDEASFTALHRGVAVGVGQFHYQTGGFRSNDDVRHDVVSVRLKGQVAPSLDLFGEYRYRNTVAGDRTLEFDLRDGDDSIDIQDERNLVRAGGHARIGANHDVALVGTYVRTNEGRRAGDATFSRPLLTTSGDSESYSVQAQHVGRFGNVSTVSGLSYDDFEGTSIAELDFGAFGFLLPPFFLDQQRFSAYAYGTWLIENPGPFAALELTGGLSLDVIDTDRPAPDDLTRVNPKFGARLDVIDGVTLRGAYMRTVQYAQPVDERLEPVTVAGFVQYVDQFSGSIVNQAGLGFDAAVTDWLDIGAEGMRRWVDINPLTVPGDTDELEIRAYVNASFLDRFAARLDFRHLDAESSGSALANDLNSFEATEVTAGLGWFHPSGFFVSGRAGVGWTDFVNTKNTVRQSGSDTFPITELSLGYRLPDRRGIASIDFLNVVDADFGFEDRTVESSSNPLAAPRFARDFAALARLRLRF